MATRNKRSQAQNQNCEMKNMINQTIGGTKRPLEDKEGGSQKKKRVFGDITNRENNVRVEKKTKKGVATKKPKSKTVTKQTKQQQASITKQKTEADPAPLSETSLASEDLSYDVLKVSQESTKSSVDSVCSDTSAEEESMIILSQEAKEFLKDNKESIDDIDTPHLNDPFQVSLYAPFIFSYYKEREATFMIGDYMTWQSDLSHHMRSILIDWLVEVQENFELNHETLYLAIKLVDLYLNKHKVSKESLQLIGATALFISCKFDERCPPVLDDFLYICDDAYQRHELLTMERSILHSVDFDLGVPLSYRFLRRYSKCAGSALVTLTLARYILETSQMEYQFVRLSDSLRAAAALLLASKMDSSMTRWTPTMVHYTGYTENDLVPLVKQYNTMISSAATSKLTTIRVKYSHRVFHEVAKKPALDILELDNFTEDSSSDCKS